MPGILSLVNKTIDEIETELDHLGKPAAVDAGVIKLTKTFHLLECFLFQGFCAHVLFT